MSITTLRPDASKKDIDAVMKAFSIRLEERLEVRGYGIFISDAETFGKIAEEFNLEALAELRANDPQAFSEELLDTMIAAFWGIVSSRVVYETEVTGHRPKG